MEQKVHKYQHDQMYTWNRRYINSFCSMCTFDHVGIYVASVPCVHLISWYINTNMIKCTHEQKLHKYQHDQMYTWNRSYINNFCFMCTFDHVGIYVVSVPCVHLIRSYINTNMIKCTHGTEVT